MAAALTISGRGFNPFGRAWAAYERSLRKHPVLTQAASSALLWGLGDAMAQRIENRGRGGIDRRRVALTAAFGGAVIGPAGHGWYLLLERLVLQLGLTCSLKSMLFKVTVDNLLYSPCYVLAFFAYGCMAIDGLSPSIFVGKMREEFVPTMLAEAVLWPPYMAFVFSRVPVKHQLLAVNVATLFDVCFLSWIRTKDVDVVDASSRSQRLPQQPETQQQQRQQHRGRARKGISVDAKQTQSASHQQYQSQQKQQQQFKDELDFVVAESKNLAATLWPWDAHADDNLGRLALMTASATCSTNCGGGGFLGLRLPMPTLVSAGSAAASAPTRR